MSVSDKRYDVVALAAICVEMNAVVEDQFLNGYGIQKGLSTIVSAEKLGPIIDQCEVTARTAGSPGSNVAAGIAVRGGKSALIGKIANDENGVFFTQRVQSLNVDYTPSVLATESAVTTYIATLVTPDKERSFAVCQGAGPELSPEDIDEGLIGAAKIAYLDFYLWLSPTGAEALRHAADIAKRSGTKVAMSLNGAHYVEMVKDSFFEFMKSHADIIVGDQHEFRALFGTETLEETIAAIQASGCTAAMTMGAAGAYVFGQGRHEYIPAHKIENIVDTSGAGDQFAAGFVYGLSQGKSAAESARIGTSWAAEILQHVGAEPRPANQNNPRIPHDAPTPRKR